MPAYISVHYIQRNAIVFHIHIIYLIIEHQLQSIKLSYIVLCSDFLKNNHTRKEMSLSLLLFKSGSVGGESADI